jgi:hypothetical protein
LAANRSTLARRTLPVRVTHSLANSHGNHTAFDFPVKSASVVKRDRAHLSPSYAQPIIVIDQLRQ